jgi:hypothetical protein
MKYWLKGQAKAKVKAKLWKFYTKFVLKIHTLATEIRLTRKIFITFDWINRF